jgi:AmmeMemoRadiSam system protein A
MEDLDLNLKEQEELLDWVHAVIGVAFGHPEPGTPDFLRKMPHGAVFVTLHLKGELRGCIGYMQSEKKLEEALRDAAESAAFKDYRFNPLSENEWNEIEVEVSLLSPMEEISGPDELIMGEHGALLAARGRQGLFLPQVASEQNWDRDSFMNQLCRKAGLPSDFWKKDSYTLYRFSARVYSRPILDEKYPG